MRDFFDSIPWLIFVFGFTAVAGLFIGGWYGYNLGEDALVTRKEIRDQCIAGNDRACEIYRADYTRGVL